MRRVCLHYTLDRQRCGRTRASRLLPVGRYSPNQRPLTGLKRGRVSAARLFRNAKSRERYEELMAPALEAAEATVERVLKEMVRLAFYDMTAILDSTNGRIAMKDPRELPEDLRRAIVGIKPVEMGDELQYECKFADKQRALESLARHLQMFKDTVIVENVFRIVNEMEDDELDRRLAELERAFGQATTLDPTSVH